MKIIPYMIVENRKKIKSGFYIWNKDIQYLRFRKSAAVFFISHHPPTWRIRLLKWLPVMTNCVIYSVKSPEPVATLDFSVLPNEVKVF